MSICRCCGQHIEAAAQTAAPSEVVRVDDTLLAVCNTAFDEARQRGHAHVEIAHAVLAIAMSQTGAAVLHRHGLNAQVTGRAAEAWLGSWAQKRRQADALATSASFKQLLRAAELGAQRGGRTHASLDDVLTALMAHGGTFWPASFWEGARFGGVAQDTSRARALHPARADTTHSTASQSSLLDREYAWLRDMARTQASTARSANRFAQPSANASAVAPGAHRRPVYSAAPVPIAAPVARARSERDRETAASSNGSRVTHLFAPAASDSPSSSRTQTTVAGDTDRNGATMQSILQRLDMQERSLSQRLDTQQRMIADLGEAFARTMRELAEARTRAAPGSACETDGTGASPSSQSNSQSTGMRPSRSARGSWRRQSWSAWRSWRRPTGSDRERMPESEGDDADEREKRFFLTLNDEIEKAPSIGPRSAALLNAVGIMTVRDLLTCDTANIAGRLHNRYITADRLTQWQAQSRLVCTIPWLRGTHAQLLAGAGYDTIDKIIDADVPGMCAAILKFAATRDGMSVLRSSPPPGEDWVIKRLEYARGAEPERAVA